MDYFKNKVCQLIIGNAREQPSNTMLKEHSLTVWARFTILVHVDQDSMDQPSAKFTGPEDDHSEGVRVHGYRILNLTILNSHEPDLFLLQSVFHHS